MVLIGLFTLANVVFAAASWNTYLVVRHYLDDATATDAELYRADLITLMVTLLQLVSLIAAAVVFLVWLATQAPLARSSRSTTEKCRPALSCISGGGPGSSATPATWPWPVWTAANRPSTRSVGLR
jgi:hypothetical protein